MNLSIDRAARHIEVAVARTADALQAAEANGPFGPGTSFATAQREAANHAVLAWSAAAGTDRSALDEGRNLLRDAKAAAERAAPHATVADALRGALEALTAAQATVPGARASGGSPSSAADDLLGWRPGQQEQQQEYQEAGAPASPDAPWSSDGSGDVAEPSPRWNPSSDTFGDDGGPFV